MLFYFIPLLICSSESVVKSLMEIVMQTYEGGCEFQRETGIRWGHSVTPDVNLSSQIANQFYHHLGLLSLHSTHTLSVCGAQSFCMQLVYRTCHWPNTLQYGSRYTTSGTKTVFASDRSTSLEAWTQRFMLTDAGLGCQRLLLSLLRPESTRYTWRTQGPIGINYKFCAHTWGLQASYK